MTQESREPSAREVRQHQYEQGERKLPQAPASIGNYSAAGIIYRLFRRRGDRLAAGREDMARQRGSDPIA